MNLPNKISIIRICLIPVFITLFYIDFPYHYYIAAAVFVLAAASDMLDGYLARKLNLITDFGKFLDPIADKLLVACALIAIAGQYYADSLFLGVAVLICTMIILCRELLVSGFRIIASSKSVVLAADKIGKVKTIVQMVALIVLLPYRSYMDYSFGEAVLYAGVGLLFLATILTIFSGANYIIRNREVLKDNT